MMNTAAEIRGRIFNIQKYSIYDGDGIRTLIFLKGCNIRCPWCANPEGLSSQFQVMFPRQMCGMWEMCGCLPDRYPLHDNQ